MGVREAIGLVGGLGLPMLVAVPIAIGAALLVTVAVSAWERHRSGPSSAH